MLAPPLCRLLQPSPSTSPIFSLCSGGQIRRSPFLSFMRTQMAAGCTKTPNPVPNSSPATHLHLRQTFSPSKDTFSTRHLPQLRRNTLAAPPVSSTDFQRLRHPFTEATVRSNSPRRQLPTVLQRASIRAGEYCSGGGATIPVNSEIRAEASTYIFGWFLAQTYRFEVGSSSYLYYGAKCMPRLVAPCLKFNPLISIFRCILILPIEHTCDCMISGFVMLFIYLDDLLLLLLYVAVCQRLLSSIACGLVCLYFVAGQTEVGEMF